ncbi:MAG: DUF3226 domain-containing protein [Paracoccaceae bacterium]
MVLVGDYFKEDDANYDYEVIILVEGKDDALLLDRLLLEIGAPQQTFRIIVCGGFTAIERHLNLISKSIEFLKSIKRIAIVTDADEDFKARHDAIVKCLSRLNMGTPEAGSWCEHAQKKYGIFIFPNNCDAGDLEEFAFDSIQDHHLKNSIQNFLDPILNANPELGKHSKRQMQVYLAVKSKRIRHTVGWAFKDRTIDASKDCFPALFGFLEDAL